MTEKNDLPGIKRFVRMRIRRSGWTLDEHDALRMACESEASAFGTVYAYAEMDHAVAFGWWRNGQIALIINGTEQPLTSLRHVRELRLFYDSGEFRIVRTGESFRCRMLEEGEEGGTPYIAYDEWHKLWGSVLRSGTLQPVPGWCALASERGTSFHVPQLSPNTRNVGLLMRSYIQFNPQRPGLTEEDIGNPNLYRFIDERFCGFADWEQVRGGRTYDAKAEMDGN